MDTVRLTRPARVRGEITVPGDKSISHRALLLAALATGTSRLRGRAAGADQESMVAALRQMGVVIEEEGAAAGLPGSITVVRGVGLRGLRSPAGDLDCGNSGATMRFLTGTLAGIPGLRARLVGDESLTRRPMERVAAPLRRMGAVVETAEGGTPPVLVEGRELTAASHDLDVASAQVKTAILLAGLNAAGRTVVREPTWSRDHTERLLERLGAAIHFHEECWMDPPASLPAFELDIPGDPSSAAFWAVLAAAHPDAELTIRGVCLNPLRTRFSKVLTRMGTRVDVRNVRQVGAEPVGDLVVASASLRRTDIEAQEIPGLVDEVPILAVAAACADGDSRFSGLGELRHKEVDRLQAVATQIGAFGVAVEVMENDLHIGGMGIGTELRGAAVDSMGDHRMAMSLAVAGSLASGVTEVTGAAAASVSYPAFFSELERVSLS